jgi:acetyltransferase-like isoleucine patch superfamily enzyme
MSRKTVVSSLVPIYLLLIGGVPAAGVAALLLSAWPSRTLVVGAAVLAPAVFVIAYILIAGSLARLTIGAIVPGRFPRDLGHRVYGPRRLYALCWTAIYYCGPVYNTLLAVPALKRVGLRLFGYRGSLRFVTYPDTWLRDLPLLDIADDAYLSNKATIGTNMCLKGGDIIVGRITIGARAMIGHLTMLAPGVRICEDVEIGVGAGIGLNVHIGIRSRVGPCVVLDHGSFIGANCTIGTRAYIGKKAVIGDGVTIPPGLVVPERAVVRNSDDLEGLKRPHRRPAGTHRPAMRLRESELV